MYGFVKIGAAIPKLHVADCIFNQQEILSLIHQAQEKNIKVLSFPELALTGYTCGDLFFQLPLLQAAEQSLAQIAKATQDLDMILAIGTPVYTDNQTFNCIAVLHRGTILGLVPKTFIPNYSEFYEERWFASAADLVSEEIAYAGQIVPIGSDLLFRANGIPHLKI